LQRVILKRILGNTWCKKGVFLNCSGYGPMSGFFLNIYVNGTRSLLIYYYFIHLFVDLSIYGPSKKEVSGADFSSDELL
jgi:hypothetical protein